MTNPLVDPYFILTKIYSDGALLKQAIAETPVEELHRARTVKIVYGVLEQDGYLSYCIRTFAPKAPRLPVRTVLKIALYMPLFMDKSRYMGTDNAVELLKKAGKGGQAGFVNAFLRHFDEKKVVLPAGDEGLCIRYGYPLFVVKRLKKQYGRRAEEIMKAKSAGVCVRFVRGEEKYLANPHIATPFPHAYIFENFQRDEGFFRGDYTFQSVGSIAIGNVVEPCENFLDACAAPGGKSVLIAGKCRRVTAFELHAHRKKLIEEYCARMGTENVFPLQKDSSVFDAAYEEAFDGVLCDVPCSGMGTVSENPDIKLNRKEEDLDGLKVVQSKILSTCSRYVKKGGYLYYSTCSLLRAENDGVVGAFLREHPEFSLVAADSPLPHERTGYGLQFLPDTAYGAGFFVCKMRKNQNDKG